MTLATSRFTGTGWTLNEAYRIPYTVPALTILTPHSTVHPAPQIRRVSRRHCALYKFTYLLTYFTLTFWPYILTVNETNCHLSLFAGSSCKLLPFLNLCAILTRQNTAYFRTFTRRSFKFQEFPGMWRRGKPVTGHKWDKLWHGMAGGLTKWMRE